MFVDICTCFGYPTVSLLDSQAKRAAAEGQALVQFLAINIVTDRPGWGVPVVLSDLTEASVFQRGTGPNDIVHIQFKNLEEVSCAVAVTAI